MSLTRIPSSLVSNTFTANTVLFANALGYLSNTSNFRYFSGNNTIAVGAVVAGGVDVINFSQAAYNAANAAGSSAYVQAAYNQANTATGIAQAAFNSANNVAPQVQPAFDKANSANVLAQSAYNSSNAVNQYAASGYALANTNVTNITLVNQFAQSGYNQANTATGLAQAAFNSANNVAPQVQPAFDKANAANSLAQSAYNSSNAVNQYATSAYGTANTNATNITLVNQFTQSAYDKANSANGLAQGAYNQANVTVGIDTTQNTLISIIQGVDLTQNTNITSVNQYAASAYAQANVTVGVDATQNTNITTANNAAWAAYAAGNTNATNITLVNQYAAGAYNQANTTIGVDATQNSAIIIIQGVDLTQNTNITTANNAAWAAYAAGNTNATNITAVNQYAQSAYNTANTKFNSSGGNITGSVTISGNNDLTVTGNLYITGTQFISNTQSFTTQDPLLVLGLGNYTSDAVDIGFASHYNDGANAHTGLIRDYGTKEYYFFKGYTPELDTNNNVNINHASFSTANVNAGYFRGNVISRGYDVLDFAQAAYNSANNVAPQVQPAFDKANTASANTIIIQGVDFTQNTRINSIETINNNQNTTIAIIQGVDLTQNTRLDGVEGTNLTQNTNITTANNAAWAAYAAGNTNSTNITYVNQFAQSAYNAANAAGSSAYVQAAFDKANNALANTSGTFAGNLTTTGNVKVSSTQAATSTTTGALTVSGGVGVSGNLYAGNIYTNGALINNSAALTVYKYVATAGQTTFSGTDVNSLTLSYVASAIFVTLNGVVLSNSLEYTATNGTSVVLGTAAELDDELNIYSFGAFQIADAYTTSQADSKFLTQANAATSYVTTANGTSINQFAAGAYTAANTAQTTATGANGLAAGAFNTANGANGLASGAYNQANVTVGVDATQNTQIAGLQGVGATQNTQISGLQGVSLATNSAISIIQGVDLTQNATITAVNNYAASAYASSNTKVASITGTNNQIIVSGTTTPTLSLPQSIHTAGTPTFASVSTTSQINAQGNQSGSLLTASGSLGGVMVQGPGTTNGAYMSFHRPGIYAAYFGLDTDNNFAVGGWSAGAALGSMKVGSFGVGTAASGTAGEIRAVNNITAYYSSDKKYKENIINIPNALNKVDAIGGKMFDWTDSYIQEHGGEDGYFVQKRDFGVIAQDVQAVFPEAVRTREDGSLAVDYSKLSALAFAAIVELKKEIEQLKNNK